MSVQYTFKTINSTTTNVLVQETSTDVRDNNLHKTTNLI